MKLINLLEGYHGDRIVYKLLNTYIPVLFAFLMGYYLHPVYIVVTCFFLLFEINPGKKLFKSRFR